MAGLLSPLSPTSANMLKHTPSMHERLKSSRDTAFTAHDSTADIPPSSPFQADVGLNHNISTSEQAAFTPTKFYTAKQNRKSPNKAFDIHCDDLNMEQDLPQNTVPTPFKIPELPSRRASEDTLKGFDLDMEDVQPSTGQKMDYIDDFNDDLSICDAPTVLSEDTCFSTFSAVPNADMTMFANLGNRTSNHILADMTPRGPSSRTPATNRKQSAAPTPASSSARRQVSKSSDGDTTSLLLDFTQLEGSNASRSRRPSPTKSSTDPSLLSYINNQRSPGKPRPVTPAKRQSVLNLLDFDLPPQPTPRSLPSITARELESLKSSYLSEISSLKASLSGKEAEVESLKKAVGDAERRVGEALETVREEKGAREHAENEKQEWEKKGREVENVMKSLKEEFFALEKEREELLQKLEDGNEKIASATRAKQDAETRALELAAKLASGSAGSDAGSQGGSDAIEALVNQRVTQQLDEKMDGLARELHAVYKKKHETKVATLKKTYEARGEKKCNELQQKLEALNKQNEELLAAKASGTAGTGSISSEDHQALENQRAEIQEQNARIAGLMRQLDTLTETQAELLEDLERERAEKGELVAAVDEMLALQVDMTAAAGSETPARASSVISGIEDFRRSISRPTPTPSALRGPGFAGESRIGRFGAPGGGQKSRMMTNIERMGSGRGAA